MARTIYATRRIFCQGERDLSQVRENALSLNQYSLTTFSSQLNRCVGTPLHLRKVWIHIYQMLHKTTLSWPTFLWNVKRLVRRPSKSVLLYHNAAVDFASFLFFSTALCIHLHHHSVPPCCTAYKHPHLVCEHPSLISWNVYILRIPRRLFYAFIFQYLAIHLCRNDEMNWIFRRLCYTLLIYFSLPLIYFSMLYLQFTLSCQFPVIKISDFWLLR